MAPELHGAAASCRLEWAAGPLQEEALDREIYGHSATVAGRTVWVLGGIHGRARHPISAHTFQLDERRWDDLTDTVASSGHRPAPCRRWGHSACLVAERGAPDRVLLCGGFDSKCNHSDVWFLDTAACTFARPAREMRHVPVHGAYHSLVFDEARGKAMLFGGQCCIGGPYEFYDSVYVADARGGGGWVELPVRGPRPAARAQHSAVIAGGSMLVYGGACESRGLSDVWALALGGPEGWTALRARGPAPAIEPQLRPGKFRVTSCRSFASVWGRSLLVLGRNEQRDMALFILDIDTGQWHAVPDFGAPAWRGNFVAWEDAGSGVPQLMVFGGHPYSRDDPDCGLWTLQMQARPDAMVVATLRGACRNKNRRAALPEESLCYILAFLTGHIAEVLR